jgi:hypothetical protein
MLSDVLQFCPNTQDKGLLIHSDISQLGRDGSLHKCTYTNSVQLVIEGRGKKNEFLGSCLEEVQKKCYSNFNHV